MVSRCEIWTILFSIMIIDRQLDYFLTEPGKGSLTASPEVRLLDLGQDDQRAVLPEDGAGERLLGDGQLCVGLQALPYRSRDSRTTTKECLM